MSELTLVATGDSIITRHISQLQDVAFLRLAEFIQHSDVAFTNLEITTPKPPVVPFSGRSLLSAQPFILDELAWIGFNLFNVANNHSVDYMYHGLLDTMDALAERNLIYAGAGRSLSEARLPAYLDTANGRVALVAAATPYGTAAQGGWATESRPNCPGRPGVNPFRYETKYILDSERFNALIDIDHALGTAASTRQQQEFGIFFDGKEDSHRFLNCDFFEGEVPEICTRANSFDLEEIAIWVRAARRQADYVIVSLHAHEGLNNGRNSPEPAAFIIEAAHAWIDAGADIFLGHGPHCLRPLEIYKGKPAFYSLGNFLFMTETLDRIPADVYRGLGMERKATPADLFDFRAQHHDGKPKGFHADPIFWQSVVPLCRFRNGWLVDLELHPINLGMRLRRTERGVPYLTDPEAGADILEQFAEMSHSFGTRIDIGRTNDQAIGHVMV